MRAPGGHNRAGEWFCIPPVAQVRTRYASGNRQLVYLTPKMVTVWWKHLFWLDYVQMLNLGKQDATFTNSLQEVAGVDGGGPRIRTTTPESRSSRRVNVS